MRTFTIKITKSPLFNFDVELVDGGFVLKHVDVNCFKFMAMLSKHEFYFNMEAE